jgi:ABC-type amino acid transport substrate-binding protein
MTFIRLVVFTLFSALCSLTCLASTQIPAGEIKDVTQNILYLGIEKNRKPFVFLDKQQKPQGILIERVTDICKKLEVQCHFIIDEFDQLLEQLQTNQLHGVVVIDRFIMPDFDDVKLTPPLCLSHPVFIQKNTNKRITYEDFENSTIGVLEGSSFHVFLENKDCNLIHIRPYPILESAIFDLITGQIDAVFADEAFYKERVMKTPFGREHHPSRLIITQINDITLFPHHMTLAIKSHNNDLFKKFDKAFKKIGVSQACSTLVDIPETLLSEPFISIN